MNIAVLGTGLMGYPMARRLCEAGHTVQAWNRTREKAERLAPFGATVHAQAADAVQPADVVICLLQDGAVVGDVLFSHGVAGALKTGTLVIDMSSIQPAQAREHAARLGGLGHSYLDAPVSGGTLGAENGTLAIMAGGPAAAFERAQAVFQPLGRATLVGPHGTGQLAKLANQMIVGITIGAVAEALLLCEKGAPAWPGSGRPSAAALPTAASCRSTASAWWNATSRPAGACRCNTRTCAMPWPPPKTSALTPR